MTYIEFFDKIASENICACLTYVPDRVVYIGDSVKDVEACQSAGVRCLSAAWQSDARKEALEAVNPGFVFDSIENLRTYLLQNIE